MEMQVYSLEKKAEGKVELPTQFSEPISANLIKRAVITLQLNSRQPYGTKPGAGTRVSAKVSRRRRSYRGSYGRGISRVPRKVLSRSGRQFFFVGALAPGTVSGRRAHPPKAHQMWERKINKKENSKAIRSALAATLAKEMVAKRGHKAPEGYPFAVSEAIEKLDKTKKAAEALAKLGLKPEIERASRKTIRAGKGKRRGRKHDRKKGLLIVVAGQCKLQKAAANIPGVEIVTVNQLNAETLAPGATPGRLTLFTSPAINKITSEKLFT